MLTWQELKPSPPYTDTIALMESIVADVIAGSASETILLLEHEEVYTAGTGAKNEDLLNPGNIPVIHTGRGGKFTYHGPGQRIIYPILNLAAPHRQKDLRLYIKKLEEWIIRVLKEFGIEAYIVDGRVGIWTQKGGRDAKIGAIGVRVRKWVTYHGVAVNIAPDLAKFNGIVPCGISDAPITSMKELGVNVTMEEFDEVLKKTFASLGLDARETIL
jgi:lipoyl(octanoyl) transferase